ncbi:MAG: hypothetical protein ABIF87_15735 [Pseudomonadota bacterium]
MGFLKKLFGTSQPAPNFPIHPADKELVTEYDIKWWKSLTLDDYKALEQQDNIFRLALYMKLVEEAGLSEEEAAKQVRKSHIYYYVTLRARDDEKYGFLGEDAKLPYVLKDRANKAFVKYIRKMDKNEIESASSMNAIVRDLIRTGKV